MFLVEGERVMMKFYIPTGLIFLFGLTAAASGVTEGAHGSFLSGFTHPIFGFDHLLAMLAVGLLSVQLPDKNAIWFVPALFVFVMMIGGLAGILGLEIPMIGEFSIVENIIWGSSFALGLTIASEYKISTPLAMIFVSIFAFFHGHAHGAEMGNVSHPGMYVLGFMIATTIIHILGVILGELCNKTSRPETLRAKFGAAIAGIGLYLVLINNGII